MPPVTGIQPSGSGGGVSRHVSDCSTAVQTFDGRSTAVLPLGTIGVMGLGNACPGVFGSSALAPGVSGSSVSGDGVEGSSEQGVGVGGWSASGNGVEGSSGQKSGVVGSSAGRSGYTPNPCGVWGDTYSGTGVYGTSATLDGVRGESRSSAHAGVSAVNDGGGYAIWAQVTNNGWAGWFDGPIHTTDSLSVDNDVVLNNADGAEDFDVANVQEAEPGTVMVINENGILKPAEKAYDKRVAGIISGAGECRPAIVLNRQRSERKSAPLALFGTVYCKVDGQYGSIEVGDLLTTSTTPGHAMKAAEPQKAFGAVIGKALRALDSGQGLIPVLVGLQ